MKGKTGSLLVRVIPTHRTFVRASVPADGAGAVQISVARFNLPTASRIALKFDKPDAFVAQELTWFPLTCHRVELNIFSNAIGCGMLFHAAKYTPEKLTQIDSVRELQ